MPAGDGQLVPLAWQPVTGAPEASLYPLVRKIDTVSSNSYLISTPDVIILIDPGGLCDQVDQISEVIRESRAEKDRPVFVFLTHIHIDHFVGINASAAFAHAGAAVFAVQENGARALEAGDARLTAAELLEIPLRPMKVALPLLTGERAGMPGIVGRLCFPNGGEISIVSNRTAGNPETLLFEQIAFGPGPALDVYHTPGHSPDSICLRLGDILFIGDILFAANPGVAGISGWSQEDLVHSLAAIERLIMDTPIRWVCPGHGRIVAGPDAARMLSAARTDALALANIAELNYERAAKTAAFAEDCMEAVNELFTIMAGRLYYVSYIMEELGESGMAEEATEIIRSATVDELLEAFRDFAEEHHRAQGISVHLMLKAGQVIGKLDRTFNRDELAGIIDSRLVERAGRLLSDYTTMLSGFTPPCEIADTAIMPVIEALVTGLSVPACSDEDILGSSDDEAAFSRILLSRIGTRPLLEDVETEVAEESQNLHALIDRDHFIDLLTYILEDLVGTGAGRISIRARQEGSTAAVILSGKGLPGKALGKRRTWQFLEGLSARTGGNLVHRECDGAQYYEFTAPMP